jgi:hypothetical protein
MSPTIAEVLHTQIKYLIHLPLDLPEDSYQIVNTISV